MIHRCSCGLPLVGFPTLPVGYLGCVECDLLIWWPRIQTLGARVYDQDAPET